MPRKNKPRTPKHRIDGAYAISTGTAIISSDPERDGAYLLEINQVPSSHLVLGAPRVLTFPYMQWMAQLIDAHLHHTAAPAPHLLHLGGAGCALPRYVADKWPDSHNTVVELDGQLGTLVRDLFDIPSPPTVRILTAEARTATHAQPPQSVDILIRDVFAGANTPRHVTTTDFFLAARRTLTPGGLYLANVGDYAQLPETSAELAGMTKAFPYIAAVAGRDMLEGRQYGNVVLVASDQPLHHLQGSLSDDLRFAGLGWVARRAGSTTARTD